MKRDNGILDMARELAVDLNRVGAIDKLTLRQIEALAVPDVPSYTGDEIREIRERNHVSQPVFASYLNVGRSTVAQWEQGKKTPSGSAARLLDLVARKGIEVIA